MHPVQIRDDGVGEPGHVLHEAGEAERPDHEPDDEKPEYRSEPETMEQRHDDARGYEENHHLAKIEGLRVHGAPFSHIV
jgi:hypothetical protein